MANKNQTPKLSKVSKLTNLFTGNGKETKPVDTVKEFGESVADVAKITDDEHPKIVGVLPSSFSINKQYLKHFMDNSKSPDITFTINDNFTELTIGDNEYVYGLEVNESENGYIVGQRIS